jgi:PAS domain S-box-containing protein
LSSSPIRTSVTDAQRLEALRRYDILDTEPESAFDRIAALAAHLFDAPVSIINFVAEDRQWFKSTVGFDEQETGLDVSFCVYTVANEAPFVVEDLAADDRFADNPYVVEDGIRFYAGAPLTTPDGQRLGTVCVLDTEPRSPSPERVERLSDLAALVVDELELRREHAERTKTAERLRQSRELLQQSQRLAQVGGWEYDVRTETLAWTEETYRIHDRSPTDAIDFQTALSFYEPEARTTLEERFQQLLDEEEPYDLELPITTEAGERRWVRTIGEAHVEDGDIVRVNGAIQDITDRRRARQQLRRQKDVLQTVFDNIPVMIALFDEKGRFQLVNQRFEELLGWEEEKIVSRSDAVQQLFPDPDSQETVVDFIQEASGHWREFEIRDKDGTQRHVLGTVVALRDGRRIGIAFDVSEKKAREQRLRLLEAAVQHARVPVLITEAAPLDEPGPTVVYANPAVEQVTGYDLDEIQGRSPRMLQGEDTDRAKLDRIRAALEQGESVQEIVRNYTKDGTMYWNDIYIAPVRDEARDVTHFVSVQADVTERIQRRRDLEDAKEAAEEADRIKGALLSNMNHEFRTPLTSIISFAQLLADKPALAETFADRILGGGQRLLRTLNTVMDFAELAGGEMTPTPHSVAVEDVAVSVVSTFQELARRRDLTVQVDPPDAQATSVLDEHLLERILTHLVSNAVKFNEEGGDVTIGIRGEDDTLELCVEDTGIGIPPEVQGDVFDEFYQVSTGDDRTHDGNGIGLTIVKRMVRRMSGNVDLQSTPGKGTRVTVTLPRDGSDASS